MPKTLAEMRADGRVRRPRQSMSMCLAPDMVAEVQSLLRKRFETDPEYGVAPDDRKDRRPKRANDPKAAKVAKINARLAEVNDEMTEHTGELTLVGIDPGEWRRWCDANPPREESDGAEFVRDYQVALSYCNADALLADLRRYAAEWNGQSITDDEWAFIEANAAPGDLKAAARMVVEMHEKVIDLGKWRNLLQGSQEIETD